MEQMIVSRWICVAAAFTALAVGALVFRLAACRPGRIVLKAYEEFTGLLQEKPRYQNWQESTQVWLRRNGAAFHYAKGITPDRYLVLRIFLSLAGFLALERVGMGFGILTALLLFFLPNWVLRHLNRKDNLRMLPEIKLIYHALEIQIRAGVYVTDALAECYGSVQEKRLQQALLDLAGDIVMKADIFVALEHFQGKFDNRYIDTLCITLIQACESGQAVELLGDIGEQLKDMEAALLDRQKSRLDRSITFYQLGVLAAVLGVILYACVSYMMQAAVSF